MSIPAPSLARCLCLMLPQLFHLPLLLLLLLHLLLPLYLHSYHHNSNSISISISISIIHYTLSLTHIPICDYPSHGLATNAILRVTWRMGLSARPNVTQH